MSTATSSTSTSSRSTSACPYAQQADPEEARFSCKASAGLAERVKNTFNYLAFSRDILDLFNAQIVDPSGAMYDSLEMPTLQKERMILITNDELIKALLRSNRLSDWFGPSAEMSFLGRVIGSNSPLTTSDEALHSKERRVYKSSTFSALRITDKIDEIAAVANRFINQNFEGCGVYNAPHEMIKYTLEQSWTNIINGDDAIDIPQVADVITRIEKVVSDAILWKLASFMPGAMESIKELDTQARQIILKGSSGILQAIEEEFKDDPNVNEIVFSAAKTALFIGPGTTRSLLVSVLLCLMRYPTEQESLYEAIKHIDLGDIDNKMLYKQIQDCKPLVHFVHEVLRLYPPIMALARQTNQEINVKGYQIAAGVSLLLSVYHSQRRPEKWPNPDIFDPRRFETVRVSELPAFSHYSTTCLGQHFALAVVYLFLVALLQKYRVEWPDQDDSGNPIPQEMNICSGMTLKFDQDLKIKLVPRID